MAPIYQAALVATLASVALYGAIISRLPGQARSHSLLLAFVLALPLQPLVFELVRVPVFEALLGWLGEGSRLFRGLKTLDAPVFEELAKLVPLLVPAVRRSLTPANYVRYAMAIGLGFGVGEMWLIARLSEGSPALAGLPWYSLGGYLTERFEVCLFHGAFVSLALRELALGRSLAMGELGSMLLHFWLNFPLFLVAYRAFGWSRITWFNLLQVWVTLYYVGAALLLSRQAVGSWNLGAALLGKARCPGCRAVYSRSLIFGLNAGVRRYERCSACRKWHWIAAEQEVALVETDRW